MILTDTHTHCYYERDLDIQNQQMERCLLNGVERLFLPNVNLESTKMIDQIVSRFPKHCFAMAGLHPCEVKEDFETQLTAIQHWSKQRKIYAIGEIGIDLYWDKTTLDFQQKAFKEQIKWAKSLELPIVIHCREAFDEVFEILEDEKDEKLRGIFHCFTGDAIQAKRAINLNFFLGIGGVVTYKKSGLDVVLSEIQLQHIVLETDSPYLAPVPFRGKTNESSYLLHIAQKLELIYGVSIQEIADITTQNSKAIFGV